MRAGRARPIPAHVASQWIIYFKTAIPAVGTGTALGASPQVTASCGVASGTGTAHAVSTSSATNTNAGIAVAETTAYPCFIETPGTAHPGVANASGATPSPSDPTVIVGGGGALGLISGGINDHGITVEPSAASATGIAQQAVRLPTANVASGTGTAYNASTSSQTTIVVTVHATASGTAAPSQVTQIVQPTAGLASGTGAAQQARASALAGLATGSATVFQSSPLVAPSPTSAAGTGTAIPPAHLGLRGPRRYEAVPSIARWRTVGVNAWGIVPVSGTRWRLRPVDIISDDLVGV